MSRAARLKGRRGRLSAAYQLSGHLCFDAVRENCRMRLDGKVECHPVMTCPECHAPIAEGSTACWMCGPEVKPSTGPLERPQATFGDLPVPETPQAEVISRPLWDPRIIAALEIPILGVIVASPLVALNWHRLNRPKQAIVAWAFVPIWLLFLRLSSASMSFWALTLLSFAVWFPIVALPQIQYLRANQRPAYPRRRWIIPIGVGLCLSFALPQIDRLITPGQIEEIGAGPVATSPPVERGLTVEEVIQFTQSVVVPVKVEWDESYLLFFNEHKWQAGSGVHIVNGDGYAMVVTNRHVIEVAEGAKNIRRTVVAKGVAVPCELVAYGKNRVDLAMLKVPYAAAKSDFLIPVVPAEKVATGQECVAIGNALDAGISVTTGVISRFDDMGNYVAIRTSAPISPGNSGGGLFRRKDGALIGITTSSLEATGAQNVNFAIPSNYVLSEDDVWEFLHAP